MNPKPTKGYVMPVKQGVYEKVNAAVKEYLLEFGMNEEDATRMMADLIQRKVPFTRINHTRTNFLKGSPSDTRFRGYKKY